MALRKKNGQRKHECWHRVVRAGASAPCDLKTPKNKFFNLGEAIERRKHAQIAQEIFDVKPYYCLACRVKMHIACSDRRTVAKPSSVQLTWLDLLAKHVCHKGAHISTKTALAQQPCYRSSRHKLMELGTNATITFQTAARPASFLVHQDLPAESTARSYGSTWGARHYRSRSPRLELGHGHGNPGYIKALDQCPASPVVAALLYTCCLQNVGSKCVDPAL